MVEKRKSKGLCLLYNKALWLQKALRKKGTDRKGLLIVSLENNADCEESEAKTVNNCFHRSDMSRCESDEPSVSK